MNIDKFRANLKSRIKETGNTQEEFSQKIGISNAALKKYMSNGRNTSLPDIEVFDKMCEVLECDYDYLMGKIDTPNKDIFDVEKVTGLSPVSVNTLKKLNRERESTLTAEQIFKIINLLLLDNNSTKRLLWDIYLYLYTDLEFAQLDKEGNISKHVFFKDINSGIKIPFTTDQVASSILQTISNQLYDWRCNIQKTQKKKKEDTIRIADQLDFDNF